MMLVMFIILGSVVSGIVLERFVAATAPLGYQDERGFHLGTERPRVSKSRTIRKSTPVSVKRQMSASLSVTH